MKITFICASSHGEWSEDYESDVPGSAEEIIGALLKRFNDTLRPGEKPRRLVRIVATEATAPKPFVTEHRWEKQNLVTISDRNGLYDKMKCKICGATGKRYGLRDVTPDKSKFAICKGYDL